MAKKISFGGICAALSVASLLLVNVFVTNKIFFTCLATVFIPVCALVCGASWGAASWLAAAAVAFFIVPEKTVWAAFLVLGAYALVKGFIEKINRQLLEWVLKLVFYAAAFGAAVLIFPFPDRLVWLFFGAGAFIFAVYDIALSLGISYLSKKIKIL